jgi:hypothetical protein
MFESIGEMDGLRRKLKGQCPCGYSFEILGSRDDAISMVRLHVESFHKDVLPFGITNDEALQLLNQGHKPKVSARTAFSVQKESAYSFRNTNSASQPWLDLLLGEDIEVEHAATERKKAQVIA